MSGEDLIEAVENNQPAEVVRLLDEEHVDVNYEDSIVSCIFILFFCEFIVGFFEMTAQRNCFLVCLSMRTYGNHSTIA